LVLLDENDEVITTDGRSVILKDCEGKVSNRFFLPCDTNASEDMVVEILSLSVCLSIYQSGKFQQNKRSYCQLGMYRIGNFAIQLEPYRATVAFCSLHCNMMMRYASFSINVVYYSVIRDSALIN